MGYPRKDQKLWSDADYQRALDALVEEREKFRARFGKVDQAEQLYSERIEILNRVRVELNRKVGE